MISQELADTAVKSNNWMIVSQCIYFCNNGPLLNSSLVRLNSSSLVFFSFFSFCV